MKKDTHCTCFDRKLPVDFHEFLERRSPVKVKTLRDLKIGLYEVLKREGGEMKLMAFEKDGWLYDIGGHGHPIDTFQIGIDVEKTGELV